MYGVLVDGKVIARFTAPLSVISNVPVFTTDTLSLKRSTSRRAAQRWEISAGLEPLSHTANDLFVLFVKKGNFEKLDIIMPQNIGAIEKRTIGYGAPVASGDINGTTISVASNSFIPKGTFIKFENHSKIYLTMGDLNKNGNVSIFPALRSTVLNKTFTWKDDVIAPVFIDNNNTSGMIFRDGILMENGEINFVEAL